MTTLRYRSWNAKSTSKSVRLWTGIIQRADVDLCYHGARESEIWNSALAPNLEFSYGSEPENWSIVGLVLTDLPIWKLSLAPGTFPTNHCLSETILWSPGEGSDEGHWQLFGSVRTIGTFVDLSDLSRTMEAGEPFKELVNGVQDDSGFVLLMQYRASRPSDARATSRSYSQPPSLRRRELAYNARHRSDNRRWLGSYHLCPYDSRWRIRCDKYEGSYDENQLLRDGQWCELNDVSSCAKGRPSRPYSGQDSDDWEWYSFLRNVDLRQESGWLKYVTTHGIDWRKHVLIEHGDDWRSMVLMSGRLTDSKY